MKRLNLIAAAIPVLAASVAMAAGISGSKHDFTAATWSDGEICKPCHTPHNAIASDLSRRLWNHKLSDASYTIKGAYVTGEGTRLDNPVTGIAQTDMDMASRLCLSCHDGTVALDSFGGKTGTVMIGSVASGPGSNVRSNLGTDLSNDHPVGKDAVYDEGSGAAGHYYYKPIATPKAAGLKFADLGSATSHTYTNQSGQSVTANVQVVSCVTCHDVHNGSSQPDNLLRMSNTGSALCLSCHTK